MRVAAIILDMDGTLYDIHDVLSQVYQYQISYLSEKRGWDVDTCVKFFNDNDIYPEMRKNSKSATELFQELGFDKNEWRDYREAHFNPTLIRKSSAITNQEIKELASVAPVYILSSNTYNTILRVLEHLGLDAALVSDIYCSDHNATNGTFKKKGAMIDICERNNYDPSDIVSIGDRYNTDIVPAVEIGGTGILVSSPKALNQLPVDFERQSVHDCALYSVFRRV